MVMATGVQSYEIIAQINIFKGLERQVEQRSQHQCFSVCAPECVYLEAKIVGCFILFQNELAS